MNDKTAGIDMGKFATNTSVSIARSRAEVEAILRRYGASGFRYGWYNEHEAMHEQVEFVANLLLTPDPDPVLVERARKDAEAGYGGIIDDVLTTLDATKETAALHKRPPE